MRYNYKIAMVLIFAIMSIATGVAFADDKLKGPYAVTGTQMCLTAPSGFANDSKGNPTIANGKDNLASVNNFQGRFSFNGDGTGSVSGTFVTIPPPDSRADFKAAVSAGTFSYSFTYSPVANNSFENTMTPGTYKGTIDYGPRAGEQFYDRLWPSRVSGLERPDARHGRHQNTGCRTHHVFGSLSNFSSTRICFVSGSLVRLD